MTLKWQISRAPNVVGEVGIGGALPADCKKGPGMEFTEFAIMASKSVYKGGEPGVLVSQEINGNTVSRTFCLVIIHQGLGENAFKLCTLS